MNRNIRQIVDQTPDREGFALVTTLLIVLVLSVLAVAVAWMATSEKKISFAEGVHVRSVYSADAGGEMGVNFLRLSNAPPLIVDYSTKKVLDINETTVANTQTYELETFYDGMSMRIGWDPMYFRDFDYQTSSTGRASTNGESTVNLVASRLYKIGY